VTITAAKDLKVEEASRLSPKLRLTAVHVGGVQARTIGGADMSTGELGWKLMPINIRWAWIEGSVRVLVPVTLHVLMGSGAVSKARVAEIGVFLRLDYELAVDETASASIDAAVSSFVGISGCLHAWPYVRAEIHQLSTKIGLPALVLPPIVSGSIAAVVADVGKLEEVDLTATEPPARPRLSKSQRSKRSTASKRRA
jgi:hypothetical protein